MGTWASNLDLLGVSGFRIRFKASGLRVWGLVFNPEPAWGLNRLGL